MNPYERLRQECRDWARRVVYPEQTRMFTFVSNKVNDRHVGWRLDNVKERVVAADQLGYDVIITVENDHLIMSYRKRPGTPPYQITP